MLKKRLWFALGGDVDTLLFLARNCLCNFSRHDGPPSGAGLGVEEESR
jgi:hypothetical protein